MIRATHSTTDAARRAFTLVEMMVALALTLIVGLVTMTAFQQGSELFSAAEARTEACNNARTAMRFLEQDLAGAFLRPDGAQFVGLQRADRLEEAFGGGFNSNLLNDPN